MDCDCGAESCYLCHARKHGQAPFYEKHLALVLDDLELRVNGTYDGCFVTVDSSTARTAAWICRGGEEYRTHRLLSLTIDLAKLWWREAKLDAELQFWSLRAHNLDKNKGLRHCEVQQEMFKVATRWVEWYSDELKVLSNQAFSLLGLCVAVHPRTTSIAHRSGETTTMLWQFVPVPNATTTENGSPDTFAMPPLRKTKTHRRLIVD